MDEQVRKNHFCWPPFTYNCRNLLNLCPFDCKQSSYTIFLACSRWPVRI